MKIINNEYYFLSFKIMFSLLIRVPMLDKYFFELHKKPTFQDKTPAWNILFSLFQDVFLVQSWSYPL